MDVFNYRTRTEADKILAGFGGIDNAISNFLGAPVKAGRDGDVCTLDTEHGIAAAIIYRGRIIARTPSGLMDYPLTRARRFWRVPCRT
jgi:hypothetical protein